MSSSTPNVSSTSFQPGTNPSTSQVMLKGDTSMDASLDGDNDNANKTIDPNENKCDAVDLDDGEEEEGHEQKRARTFAAWLEFKEIALSDGSHKWKV